MRCGPIDTVGSNLRLEYRRHRLRLLSDTSATPVELWSVERGQLHHCDVYVALLMNQFTAHGISEPADGALRPAVRRLQWNRSIGEGRSHLNDGPRVALLHPLQCCLRSP